MSKEVNENKIVFAVYPNANGFGYVYLENARKLIDFGTIRIRPIFNIRSLKRIRQCIEYLRPAIVIVQDPEGQSSRTGNRVRRLYHYGIFRHLKRQFEHVEWSIANLRKKVELNTKE